MSVLGFNFGKNIALFLQFLNVNEPINYWSYEEERKLLLLEINFGYQNL
jgi:hypothetical protein